MPESYLGLDVGTKNIKATVVSSDGRVLEKAITPVYDLISRAVEGSIERSPTAVWKPLVNTLSHLDLLSKISGMCVDATSGTVLPIGSGGRELHDLIMYNDSRARCQADQLRDTSEAAREFELFLPINPQLVVPKVMWLRDNLKEFDRVSKILHESDYIAFRLCGDTATSSNTAGKSHALLTGTGYLRRVYEDVGLNPGLMPEIRPIGEIVGYSNREAAELGIPEGTPVVNGITDASAGDLTSGTLNPGQVNVTLGTSLVVHAVTDRVAPDPHKRFYYKTYLNNRFLAGGTTNAGTSALDSAARFLKADSATLTQLASVAPAGADGLMACSEWFGVRVPITLPVNGFLIGLSERTATPGHIFRSLMEGSAMALKLMLSAVEETTAKPLHDLRVSGGASRNELFMQIIADSTGKEVKTVEEPDSSTGSALLAAWGAGKHDITDLVKNSVKIRSRFTPTPEKAETYERLCERYSDVVHALAELAQRRDQQRSRRHPSEAC